MKNYFIYYVLLIAFISCDSAESLHENPTSADVPMTLQHRGDAMPFNTQNPYDSIGIFHNELVDAYYAQGAVSQDVDLVIALVESVASEHPYFLRLTPSAGPSVSPTEIATILIDPAQSLSTYMGESILGAAAQDSLYHFVDSIRLVEVTDANYAAFYDYVVVYEAGISSHSLFSAQEKRVLLQITAIARHNAYKKRKRPKKNTDLDWNWMTTCAVGSAAGASGAEIKGVLTTVVVGVLSFEP